MDATLTWAIARQQLFELCTQIEKDQFQSALAEACLPLVWDDTKPYLATLHHQLRSMLPTLAALSRCSDAEC